MTDFLINYIKKYRANTMRESFGILSGAVGIICNILLCALKFTVGSLTGAVSITADAVNNLSDAATNSVTIVGAKLAGKPVDKEHPFGHGRIEYVSALVVAFSIFLMSFGIAKNSVDKIINPSELEFSAWYFAILGAAILVKLWMAYFNNKLYKITENVNMKAVKTDSLNDSVATLATAGALFVSGVFHIRWVDGAVGLAVSVFVFFSGVSILRDIIGPLLGEPPSKELVSKIEEIICDSELVLGVHDLIVHNYGAESIIASAHAEVPSDIDVLRLHEAIDTAENRILKELGVNITIHMDPIVVDDDEREKYKELTEKILLGYNSKLSFHDFRINKDDGKTKLIFDVVIPFENKENTEKTESDIGALFEKELPEVNAIINFEHSYI